MFKRVEKRRKRKQEEEELGLDLNDTDSEESSTTDSDDSGLHVDQVDDDRLGISVKEALRDPLYVLSLDPTVNACILCPGKLLKGTKVIQVHLTSNAHQRHMKSFRDLASAVSPEYDAWSLVHSNLHKQPASSPSENSKRSQKRNARAALQKARREKQKAKDKLKKTVVAEPTETAPAGNSPPKKKQKIAIVTTSPPASAVKPSPQKVESTNITDIVRSASTRAIMARLRASNQKKNEKLQASGKHSNKSSRYEDP